jgi:creatinine amidohydrolase
MELERCNYRQVNNYLQQNDAVIIPLGAIEQHGPGCSVGTDARIPEKITFAVAEELLLMRAPIVSYGVSVDHLRFPGTVSLRPSTLTAVFRDMFESLYGHGFRRFFVLNGHFDNSQCLKGEILTLIKDYTGALIYLRDFWEFDEVQQILQSRLGERGGHGDAADVALMMYLAADEVDYQALVEEWPSVDAFVSINLHSRYVTRSGVIGSDQRKATLEIGKELYLSIVECFKRDITRLQNVELLPEGHPKLKGGFCPQ